MEKNKNMQDIIKESIDETRKWKEKVFISDNSEVVTRFIEVIFKAVEMFKGNIEMPEFILDTQETFYGFNFVTRKKDFFKIRNFKERAYQLFLKEGFDGAEAFISELDLPDLKELATLYVALAKIKAVYKVDENELGKKIDNLLTESGV